MATLSRFCSRALLLRNSIRPNSFGIAQISTSKKDKDTSVTTTPNLFENGLPEKFDARVTNKIWVSWGFDAYDREKDATFIHLFFFFSVTLAFVFGGYYIAYTPPKYFGDWAQREAYIKIREREAAGLPHIERDLIPADQVKLPTDEELGNTKIII